MADVVNEKSDSVITATFKDQDGNLITPDSGTYRIDDFTSGDEILGDTAFSPSSSSHAFVVTPAQNAIINTALTTEKKVLTVTFLFSTKQGTEEFEYIVKNLFKIT